MKDWLSPVADVATILTFLGAVFAYGKYLCDRARKRWRVETYLKGEKMKNKDQGQRSLLNIMAALALTEADILQAAFDSKKIKPRIQSNVTQAHPFGSLLLEYVGPL
jgi:hypothetical protein